MSIQEGFESVPLKWIFGSFRPYLVFPMMQGSSDPVFRVFQLNLLVKLGTFFRKI